jgi:uroporphyrinogen decarboxylase
MDSVFLDVCRGRTTSRTPVWMMRQAGRYLPEYRAVRSRIDFLTLCKTPELAAEVTVQPIDRLGVDAAVIFSDILIVLEALGMDLTFAPDHGPRLGNPIRKIEDVDKLNPSDLCERLSYVYDSIRLVSKALTPRNVPVLGFAGAPLTLACYAIEGKTTREFHITKAFLYRHPEVFERLLGVLAEAVRQHLEGQMAAGASAVQIFDTWGGMMSQSDYRRFMLPTIKKIVEPLRKQGVPVILYLNGSTPHLESMQASGATVLSVDWRFPLSKVRERTHPQAILQGNLDPTVLYSRPAEIQTRVRQMLEDNGGNPIIGNLGHGILPDIPVEHAQCFVEAVKAFRTQKPTESICA